MCVSVCVLVVFCQHTPVDPKIYIRYQRVHRNGEKTFISVVFAKKFSFRSYGYQRNQQKVGKSLMTLIF